MFERGNLEQVSFNDQCNGEKIMEGSREYVQHVSIRELVMF